MNLQRFARRQLALQHAAHFGMVEGLHRQLVERIIRRGQGIVGSAENASSAVAAGKSPGSRKHISRRVMVI